MLEGGSPLLKLKEMLKLRLPMLLLLLSRRQQQKLLLLDLLLPSLGGVLLLQRLLLECLEPHLRVQLNLLRIMELLELLGVRELQR